MVNYRLSETAKNDLIQIHQFGVRRFGVPQADKYFDAFFTRFELIAKQP
jgi:toxin ParE1/3/4